MSDPRLLTKEYLEQIKILWESGAHVRDLLAHIDAQAERIAGMLAALKGVAYEDDRKVTSGHDYLIHQTRMEAVKAAIAKAEGR